MLLSSKNTISPHKAINNNKQMLCISDADFGHLPYCWSPESYRHAEKLVNALFFYGQWTPNQCRSNFFLPFKCESIVFL